jgi:hypothetical protein
MFTPFTIWLLFSLAVAVLCWTKPAEGRIFMGCFFVLMALGVNVVVTLINPEIYVDFSKTTFVPLYRWGLLNVVALAPVAFGLAAAAFELALAALMLSKGKYVRLGLIVAIIFQLAITPLSIETLACPVFALALALLLRREYDTSLLDMMRSRFASAN